ncbi:MAG: hypothetical protein CVV41_17695 [Candidatus Riflebacteria bacterium HGW-Riflebacteria-1]|jgi:dsDNA-specific endonuclease/ATPase MutS2|nr:MAG: hypothetical protein CVV41_17695 [Candidatus Riflebacteria bacterium HGW-Riflebacteria-1]
MNNPKAYQPATTGTAWVLANLSLSSPYGRKVLKELQPALSQDREQLEMSLQELANLIDFCRQHPEFIQHTQAIFRKLRNIAGSVLNLHEEQVPDEIELFEIKLFAIHSCDMAALVAQSGLRLADITFDDFRPLVKLLNPDEMTISSFHLHDSYSAELKSIRHEKRQLENQILGSTERSAAEHLRQQRSELVRREKEQEYQVRSSLGQQLKPWLPALTRSMATIGHFEMLLARAVTALTWPSCRPELLGQNEPLRAVEAINPQMYEILKGQSKEFTPVTIEVIKGTTLITGANMGGKSVALMTVATNAELVRLGFFAFAVEFSMPLFDYVSLVAGDGQDQASGLSSFGAEVMQLKELAAITSQGCGFAVFDEFARSTNPYEGRRFVQALGEFLQQTGWHGIIATHYDGINLPGASCYQVIGLKNKHPAAPDSSNLRALIDNLCANMDYRLRKLDGHSEVPHDALHIATLLNADSRFLSLLKKLYD